MQPLGTTALLAAYTERIKGHHDYTLAVDVLDMEENPIGPARLIDGQINILPDSSVRRTVNLTLLDPDSSLGLDAGSVYQSALFADRLVRVRHTVDVPGFGDVTCTPFVGPITRLNRNGATIDIEGQDKTGLCVLGTRPYTVKKGMNAVQAVHDIMYDRCGERHFRLPAGTRQRLARDFSVGWADEASPWVICSRIARAAGMRLFYSCDGYLTMGGWPTAEVFEFDKLSVAPAGDHDFAAVINHARATAGDKIVKTATAPVDHPLFPGNATNKGLSRNGVPRYLPSLAEVDAPPDRPSLGKRRKASKAQANKYNIAIEKWQDEVNTAKSKAQAQADALLEAGLPMTAAISFSAVPVFHLDVDDPIRVTTVEGSARLRFSEATIPLMSGEMTVGSTRRGRPTRIKR